MNSLFAQGYLTSSDTTACDILLQRILSHKIGWDCTGIATRAQNKAILKAVDCYKDNGNFDMAFSILLGKQDCVNQILLELINSGWVSKLAELYFVKYGRRSVKKQIRKASYSYQIDDIFEIIAPKGIPLNNLDPYIYSSEPVSFYVEIYGQKFSLRPNSKLLDNERKIISSKIIYSEADERQINAYCKKVWESSDLFNELKKLISARKASSQ